MDIDTFIESAQSKLHTLLGDKGRVLYSAAVTLQPGRFYFLGLNPGGEGGETLGESLASLPSRVSNAYLDETWSTRRRTFEKGQHPLQKSARFLFEALGHRIESVCATNLIFTNSPREDGADYPARADICWPVHEMLLEIVRPRVVIAFGRQPFEYVSEKLSVARGVPCHAGHQTWKCHVAQRGDGIKIIGLPHLSIYSLMHKKSVLDSRTCRLRNRSKWLTRRQSQRRDLSRVVLIGFPKWSRHERHASRQVPSWLIFDVRQASSYEAAMGNTYDCIDAELKTWLQRQKLFFVATAPLSPEGHINCSPKGGDTFRVIGPREVAYLDLTGSGIETIAHAQENGRIVVMFCAFDGAPQILRLHGKANVIYPSEPEFERLEALFPRHAGARAVVMISVTRISDSCGYAVPRFDFVQQRDVLDKWTARKTSEELSAYRVAKNSQSIDGLPGHNPPNKAPEPTPGSVTPRAPSANSR